MNDQLTTKFTSAILICSDRAFQGIRPDETAPLLLARLEQSGFEVVQTEVAPDDIQRIARVLRDWVSKPIHLLLTSGGTGLAPTDLTPEATLDVIERRVLGIEEVMRRESLRVTPHAMLSRAVAGVAGTSLIINLPGSPRGAVETFDAVAPALQHALQLIAGEKPDK